MNDWIWISQEISFKNYNGHIHTRKLNLKIGKYSYMTLYDWELETILERKNILATDAMRSINDSLIKEKMLEKEERDEILFQGTFTDRPIKDYFQKRKRKWYK